MIKAALLSYGMSGKVFHAPFLNLHPGFELAGAWERSKKLIQADYPSVESFPTLEAVLQNDTIDLVVVNTPNYTHYDYTKQALQAGKHVIVEKAFTNTLREAEELKALAEEKGLMLSVFQNRRWDSDFLTVKKVVEEGWLGELTEVEMHYDRYKPELNAKAHKEEVNAGSGILKDLGPHLIDQALSLFGMPNAVFADSRITRPGSLVDDYFEILLYYPTLRVRLKAGFLVREPFPAYVLHGLKGSFHKQRADTQEARLIAGEKPDQPDWGTEPDSEKGLLHTEKDGTVIRDRIPTERGSYLNYYEGIYEALTAGAPVPVSATDGVNVMRVIEAAAESSEEMGAVRF